MTTTPWDTQPRPARIPGWGWWLLTAVVLGALLAWGWIAALALLAFLLIQRARPLDFLTSFLVVIAAASVVNYSAGRLTAELSILSVVLIYMLFCYVLYQRRMAIRIPQADLTRPLLLYAGLSLFNFGRGMLAGNSWRYGGLELLAMLAMCTVFLAANLKINRRTIAICATAMFLIGVVHCTLGLYAYAVIGMRTGAIFFQALPGILVAFGLPFVLREPHPQRRWLWLLALVPMFLHQFISFTRGYWMAMIGSTVYSIALYGGRGPGAPERWRRAGSMVGLLAVAGVLGIMVFATAFGFGDIFQAAGERFASSGSTEVEFESTSNIVRLGEYLHVLGDVFANPIFGYGLGYSFVVEDAISSIRSEHWFVHQNYLLVWLKQGIFGLILFVWVLVGALVTGWRGRSLPDPYQASWCAGASAVAMWLLLYCNVHFPLAEVNSTFATALIWGGAVSLVARNAYVLRWRRPHLSAMPPP